MFFTPPHIGSSGWCKPEKEKKKEEGSRVYSLAGLWAHWAMDEIEIESCLGGHHC